MKTFIEIGVPKKFADMLSSRGIASPFEIQEAALPDGLAGLDVCGKAPTGSGKTIAFGLVLAVSTSLWSIAIGAAAILAAWTYTGGKRPYGYLGLGEISVFLFFGLVATMGSYYVQTEKITWQSFIVAIPMGCLSCSILAINNLRDRAQDELVGKRTLAVRLGDAGARKLFIGLLLLSHFAAISVPDKNTLITLALLPQTLIIATQVRKGAAGPALIPLLGKTGQLQLWFAVALSIALALN